MIRRNAILIALLVVLAGTIVLVVRHGVTVNGTCTYLCVNGK